MDKIKGTGVALVTPFNKDKSIDYKGLEPLLNHVINGGVDYLVLMGTTGESTLLTKIEKKEIVYVPLPTDDEDLLKKGPFKAPDYDKDKKK